MIYIYKNILLNIFFILYIKMMNKLFSSSFPKIRGISNSIPLILGGG